MLLRLLNVGRFKNKRYASKPIENHSWHSYFSIIFLEIFKKRSFDDVDEDAVSDASPIYLSHDEAKNDFFLKSSTTQSQDTSTDASNEALLKNHHRLLSYSLCNEILLDASPKREKSSRQLKNKLQNHEHNEGQTQVVTDVDPQIIDAIAHPSTYESHKFENLQINNDKLSINVDDFLEESIPFFPMNLGKLMNSLFTNHY